MTTPSSKSDPRHKLALYYLNKIKLMAQPGALSDNDIDFVHNVLESEKLTLDVCKLTDKEFEYLARVAGKAINSK